LLAKYYFALYNKYTTNYKILKYVFILYLIRIMILRSVQNMESKELIPSVLSDSIEDRCPFLTVQKVLSGKWSLLILCYLRSGAMRFGDLQRYIPEVTQTTLTKTLRKLESDKLITRTIFPEVPPHVEYALSDIGLEIIPVLDSLGEFGIKYLESLGLGDTICRELNTGSCRCCRDADVQVK